MEESMNKEEILQHLRALLHEKLNAAQLSIASTRASFASETKSSAGDKHEVGRAMIQQELDQQEAQLAKLQAQVQELERMPMDRELDHAGWGSLVATDQECLFHRYRLRLHGVGGGTVRGGFPGIAHREGPPGQAHR